MKTNTVKVLQNKVDRTELKIVLKYLNTSSKIWSWVQNQSTQVCNILNKQIHTTHWPIKIQTSNHKGICWQLTCSKKASVKSWLVLYVYEKQGIYSSPGTSLFFANIETWFFVFAQVSAWSFGVLARPFLETRLAKVCIVTPLCVMCTLWYERNRRAFNGVEGERPTFVIKQHIL